MYEANEIKFDSYLKAVAYANANKVEVFEVRADGSKIRRWAPAAPVTSRKMRRYLEQKAAYEAQEKAKIK